MKKQKIEKTVFNSDFSENWRKEHTHSNGRFTKDATDCKRMIREFAFWRLCRLLSVLANLATLLGGAFALFSAWEHVIVFRVFLVGYVILQGMLIFNLWWLTKGEGRISENRIPGRTARQLASAWDEFLKVIQKTDLLKEMTLWSKTTGSGYFGHNEMVAFFKYILKEKGRLIEDLEAAGKEEKRKLEREKMSVIYSIAETLKFARDPFTSFFPSASRVTMLHPKKIA